MTVWNWLIAALNAVAVLLMGASRLNLLSGSAWAPWVLSALGVTSIVPVLQTLVVKRAESRQRKQLENERLLRDVLASVFVYLSDKTELDCLTTGLHVFFLQGKVRPRLWPPFRWRTYRHEHIAALKLTPNPPSTGIEWGEDKGVIGMCRRTLGNVTVDLRDHFGALGTPTKAQWLGLSAEQTFRLTFDEYVRTRDYFGIVTAVPILDRKKAGRYLGCVSLDTRKTAPRAPREAIEDSLRAVAATIEVMFAHGSLK